MSKQLIGCVGSHVLAWTLVGCGDPIVTADSDPTTEGSSGAPETTSPTETSVTITDSTSATSSSTDTSTTTEADSSSSSGASDPTTGETTTSDGSESTSTDAESSSGTDGSSTDVSATDPSTSTTMDPTTDGTEETGIVFIQFPDGGGLPIECSLWDQDCPEGEKCMPWANDGGGSWNATRCSPLDPNPGQPGDACMVEGSGVSGIDDCDIASMCWDVDPDTNVGECVAFCMGNEQNPVCADPSTSCVIANDGLLILCLPMCDPLLQDCEPDETCIAVVDMFTCVPDASGDQGQQNDPCEFLNVCDPGLACVAPDLVPDCDGDSGCCTAFCDLDDGQANATCAANAGAGAECVPFYEDGQAPPGFETVGLCVVPG